MKSIFFLVVILTASFFSAFAEDSGTNCYYQYNEIFERRGSTKPKDGIHKKVVITIRKDGYAECYYGRVRVNNERVNLYEMYLSFGDGTEEKLTRNFKDRNTSVQIINGVTTTAITKTEELINIFFIKNMKPKKKKYKKASPADLRF